MYWYWKANIATIKKSLLILNAIYSPVRKECKMIKAVSTGLTNIDLLKADDTLENFTHATIKLMAIGAGLTRKQFKFRTVYQAFACIQHADETDKISFSWLFYTHYSYSNDCIKNKL